MSDSLRLEELVVQRGGRDVVHGVTLEITPGEITALLGPNGAGKSSMVLACGGVLPLKAGKVRIGDQVLSGRRPEKIREAGLAIVPEGRRLLVEQGRAYAVHDRDDMSRVEAAQTPTLFSVGAVEPAFLAARPFTP